MLDSPAPSGTSIHRWLCSRLPSEVEAATRRLAASPDVRHIALMPDTHWAGNVCVGSVFATRQLLYHRAVGGDLGCGMAAMRLQASAELFRSEAAAARILWGLEQRVPILGHPRQRLPTLPDLPACSCPSLDKALARDARAQFGSLGRGNHFLELQADPQNQLWIMVHSGSRSFGKAVAGAYSYAETAVESGSTLGRAFLNDLAVARAYARANRREILRQVQELFETHGISSEPQTLIDCDHNHIQAEDHFGRTWWVHRKGALSAHAGEAGLIPGSMATASFHVEGRGQPASLCSSSHGAGRKWTRQQARKSCSLKQLRREMRGVWFDQRRALQLCEEAPAAYRDIRAVMRAQRDLTRVVRELRPVLVYKG